MPSLKTLFLSLVAMTTNTITTAFAAPINPPFSVLAKRAEYHPASALRDDDYCGEAVPRYTYGSSAPKVADCQALDDVHPGPGYWLVTAAETRAKEASGEDRWTRLAVSGTCVFEVRLGYHQSDDELGVVDYRFGTNDVRFYVRAHATDAAARDGRVGVSSGVWCRRGNVQGQVTVEFRIVHV
ncbi:hypothetical protein P885DRAFT_45774 [Corynascus similis CBS 632.67]